ncbi:MAG: fimbrial protein, partial [Bacteroidales bacterium]|nr:fimbrial protein [Bacteroidales bacterium]
STLDADDEQRIYNLYVFVFDPNGDKIYAKWYDDSSLMDSQSQVTYANDDCWYVDNSSDPVTGVIKLRTSSGTGYKIYAISNIDSDIINVSPERLGTDIQTENDLLNFKATLLQDITSRNGYFPMSGKVEGVTVTENNISTPNDNPLYLKRMDAKIRFIFKADTETADARGQHLKSFTPMQWKVVNIPRSVYAMSYADRGISDSAGHDAGTTTDDFFSSNFVNFEDFPSLTQSEFSFYMPENRRSPKMAPETYRQRNLQVKDSETGVNETDSEGNREFEYADDLSSYVLVTGKVEMDLTDDSAGQTLGANVQYLIHLGNFDTNEGGSISDFNVDRNTSYTYTITVSSVNNIRVEVETETTENQPGATGDVTIAKEEIMLCDAHYVSKTISFHAANIREDLTWYVRTPFCDGGPETVNGEELPTSLDYKWVHFRINKKDDSGNYFEEKRRAYTPTAFVENSDGTNNDGSMDIIQLMAYIKQQKEKYNISPSASDFDNTDEVMGGPKISVTAFVDEYYYDENPITGIASPDLWKEFTNQPDRYLHIMCDSNFSKDQESRVTGSVVTIEQKSIQTIFNTDLSNTSLSTAWGVERTDEYQDLWRYNESSDATGAPDVTPYEDRGNNDLFNGRLNSAKEWGLCPSWSSTFETGKKWSDYMDVEVANDVPILKENYEKLRYSCMARNRDNNGNGVIDKDEVRWYMASIRQLIGLWIGADILDPSSKLYNRNADQKNSSDVLQWREHVISSTEYGTNSNNPYLIWGEEGGSTGDLSGSYTYGGVTKWSVRCVRNLGMDENSDLDEIPQDYINVTKNPDNSYTFSNTYLNDATLRYYTSRELDLDDELSEQNRVYKSFRAAPAASALPCSEISFATLNNNVTNSKTNPYCPPGYRLPNQRELTLMKYYITDSGFFPYRIGCRTYWSMGPLGSDKWPRDYYGLSDNVYLHTSTDTYETVTGARCVRDVKE